MKNCNSRLISIGKCASVPLLTLIAFSVLFEIWKLDLRLPIFDYSKDSLFYLFVTKTVIDSGWFFSNELVGLPHLAGQFSIHDFSIHGDSFNFLIIKIISYFSKDVFLVVNLYFILTFLFISTSSYLVLRNLKISYLVALLISILFAFSPYHLYKNVWHLFLSNYMVIPLTILIALWIIDDKLRLVKISAKGKFYLSPNNNFYFAALLTLFISTNGAYYALYCGVIFIFAWLIYSVRKGAFINHNLFTIFTLGSLIILSIIALYMPALVYWANNGLNDDVGVRHVRESNIFGLKISQLFAPAENHYLESLVNIRQKFDNLSPDRETKSEALGILGSCGFIFLLLWFLFRGFSSSKVSIMEKTSQRLGLDKSDKNLIFNLSSLNILIILYATVGGFVIFASMAFPLLRSHARFSIYVAFISLTVVGLIFDKFISSKGNYAKIVVIFLCILALFDQVGRLSASSVQSKYLVHKFESDQEFVQDLESDSVTKRIFVLPVFGFPESTGDEYQSLMGYIHSQNLSWSYPVIQSRESHLWQEEAIKQDFDGFIAMLKSQGFDFIVINEDQMIFSDRVGEERMEQMRDLRNKVKKHYKARHISKDLKFNSYELQ